MRKIIAVLIAVMTVLDFASAYTATNAQEREAFQNAASEIGQVLAVPQDPALADPDVWYRALLTTAQAEHANVFRPAVALTRSEHRFTQYVLLTGETRLDDRIRLDSGRLLQPGDMDSVSTLVASRPQAGAGQVGVVRDFAGDDDFQVRPLRQAFESLPVAGTYYVELPSDVTVAQFADALARQLIREGGAGLTGSDLLPAAGISGASMTLSRGLDSGALRAGALLLLLVLALALAYQQLYEAKACAVRKVQGYSNVRVWVDMSGRFITVCFGAATLALLAATLLVHDSTWGLARGLLGNMAVSWVLSMAISALTIAYLERIRMAEALKSRKDTRLVFALNTTVKVVASALAISIGGWLLGQYLAGAAQVRNLADWSATADYGVFYPATVGEDLLQWQNPSGPNPEKIAESGPLYTLLNEQGALYVDAGSFDPKNLQLAEQAGRPSYLSVNPNYLAAFPILGADGEPVAVAESETDRVVLVPERYRSREAEIVEQVAQQFSYSAQIERDESGDAVPEYFDHQGVRVMWIRDGQDVFTFAPDLEDGPSSTVRDPAVIVHTAQNSLPTDRANAITGGIDGALKVRLDDRDPQATMERLGPELRWLKLDDNLTHLVTLSDYTAQQEQELRDGMRSTLIALAGLLAAITALIVQNASVIFEQYSRRIVVRRLFGYSFARTYATCAGLYTAVWLAEIVGAIALNAAGISPFSTQAVAATASAWHLAAAAAVVIGLDAAVSGLWLVQTERRRTPDVLKTEF